MKPQHHQIFKKSALCLALSSAFTIPNYAVAAEVEDEAIGIERIQVTASRRSSTVQEAPLNITALDGDILKDQNIAKLSEVARWVPGLSIPEQGGRGGNNIIVRGLSTNSTGPDSDGGTVATYFGEMPLAVDVRLIDMERVEVLIGPQGTLYGAGTLGGAIRYIPKKAETDVTSVAVSGDMFQGSESDSIGGESSFIVNTPIIDDTLAIRASVNYYNDPGFIDYDYVVKEGGVSNPDPDWSNSQEVNDNLRSVKDANGEKVFTSRIALRWTPNEWFDGTLTYLYQKSEIEGRSVTNYQSLGDTNPLKNLVGKYSSAARYLEPDEDTDSLISLELEMDLGFAQLVSATGYSENENLGQRDQTDLLIANPWSYETFPTFSAFTRETADNDSFTQELRLVSQSESALSWIVGGYYNKSTVNALSEEYTPEYAEFVGSDRADDLEYLQYTDDETEEMALFGELSYQASEQLNVTLGARFYQYDIKAASAFTLGLWDWQTDLIGNSLVFNDDKIERTSSDGDGSLFKVNVSYQFNEDVMGYATISEGFRLGGTNGIAACPDPLPEGQILCALPNEFSYEPDTTTNYELGFKSTWFKNQFHFNAAIFNVDWEDAQVGGASTINGNLPYTTNAGSANSKGVEISSRAMLSDSLTAFATFSYAKAELTSDVPGLFQQLSPEDFDTNAEYLATQAEYSGEKGDRLPGAPETQFSLGMNYTQDVFEDKILDVIYGLTYQSDIVTRAGEKSEGETLPGFALSNISATLSDDAWSVTLYVDNMFDKFAYTSARSTSKATGTAEFPSQIVNPATVGQYRAYAHYVTPPRTIGLKFNYLFDM